MAVPTFVAAGTGAAGLGTATPGMPSGATTGDLLGLVIESWGDDGEPASAPTGGAWTLIGSATSGTGDVDKTTCSAYWAPYDSGINLTVPDAGNHTIARVYAFRGTNISDPFDVSSSGFDDSNSTSQSVATGLTTTGADRLVCLAFTHGDDNQTPTSYANTSLTSVGDGGAFESSAGNDGLVGLWYGTRAAAGTGGTFTWSTTGGEECAWVSFTLQPSELEAAIAGVATVTAAYGGPLEATVSGVATVTAAITNTAASLPGDVTFVAAGNGDGQIGAATPGMPAGATTNDLLVLAIESWGDDGNPHSAPTGGEWTAIGSATSGTGDVDKTVCSVYWAPYASGINRTVPDEGNHQMARIYAFRGVDTADPFDGTSSGTDTTNNTSHSNATGITTTGTDRLVAMAFTHGDDNQTPTGVANTSLTSVSDAGAYESTAGNDGLVGLWYGTLAAAGSGGTFTWNTTGGEESSWVSFALKPGGEPAPTALDAVTATQGTTSHTDTQSSWSWSHTCTGFPRVLFVQLGHATTNQTAGDVTYNGVNMSFIAAIGGGGNADTELWGLENPATGSNTVAVTYSTSYDDAAHASVSFAGVTTWSNVVISDGSSDTPNLTVPSVTADNVAFAVGTFAGADTQTTVSPNSGTSETHDYDSGSGSGDILAYGGYRTSTGASEYIEFTSDAPTSTAWSMIGVELGAATGTNSLAGTVAGVATFAATLSNTGTLSFTMTPDGDGTISTAVTNENGNQTNLYASIDDDPDTPTVTDYIKTVASDGYTYIDMTATPAGFGTMTFVTVRVDTLRFLSGGEEVDLYAQIFASDETTEYTGETLIADETSADGLHEVPLVLNTAGLTAGPVSWDAARLRLRWEVGAQL